mmetsp:Transcript_75722/g.202576  ORF Transcript_75722/g.202576 Transcript_75722/m.202576 type:complete len:201 (+) Transcript_75722:328-930(+)
MRIQIAVEHDDRKHQLVQGLGGAQILLQLQPLHFAAISILCPCSACHHVHGCLITPLAVFLMLAPPDSCHPLDKTVNLLQVRRNLQIHKSLDQAGDHASAEKLDGVDEFQPQNLGEAVILPEERADLRQTHPVSPQKPAHIHRVVPHAPACDQESKALPGLMVEKMDADPLQLGPLRVVPHQGGPRDEEGLVPEAAVGST